MQVPPEVLIELGRLSLEKALAVQQIERQQQELALKDQQLDALRMALDEANVPVADPTIPEKG